MKLFDVYPLFDIEPVEGRGNYIFDESGKKYLDLYGGHAVISVGHSHPHYVKKITQQLKKIGFYSNSVQNPLQQELADKLGRLSSCKKYQLFLCNSGAEANENALKLASFATGKKKIIAFEKGFHGRTSAAVNTTDNKKIQAPINKTFKVNQLRLNDIDAVKKSLKKGDTCAVIIEGVQGIGGINIPKKDFLTTLARLCKKHNVPLILDEVQSGYGRTGKFFAFQHAGIEPDIITMAKGMGNGFPIGGLLIHPKYKPSYGLLGHTFGGNHLACAAGIAVLDIIKKEKLLKNTKHIGNYLMKKLKKMEAIKEVRGLGLMIGLEFDQPIKALRKHLVYNEQVFTGSSSNPNVMRLLPPLNLGKNEADLFLKKLEKSIKKQILSTVQN